MSVLLSDFTGFMCVKPHLLTVLIAVIERIRSKQARHIGIFLLESSVTPVAM